MVTRSVVLAPPDSFFANVEIKRFHVTVCTLDKAWIHTVRNAGSEVWQARGDIFETWATICAAANDLNCNLLEDN